jgi:hypothetical protein
MPTLAGHLFQGLTEEALREISRIGKGETHGEGDFVFHAGDLALSLFILLKGRVRVGERVTAASCRCSRSTARILTRAGGERIRAGGCYQPAAGCQTAPL